MTGISDYGRIVAEQVVSSASSFGDGLASSIAKQGAGGWSPGPLWDNAILAMRTQGGSLAQNLENLKMFGPEVLEGLSPALRAQLDDQLKAVKKILDEIHTDRGGDFAELLKGFQSYGDQVSNEIKGLLAKADEAQATAARTSIEGSQTLGWDLVEDAGKETVKVTEQAGQNVATKAAGSRG
ncbi:MAG: hypothetical protein JWL76_1124 [Thermoleophilia bacterium]|nr:hypothetical protein [Thermoleophilia bacterium]